MLVSLHIENYALIRSTDIQLSPSFIAITGETGAGKSIMLGALGLLLGQRADMGALQDNSKKCIVEAQFTINNLSLESFFEENDLDYDDTLLLRREILPSGKSRAFVNDTPVGLPILKELGPKLIDIHSQHETLHLADGDFQLSLLDNYTAQGEHQEAVSYRTAYNAAHAQYISDKRRLEQLVATEAANRREQDYLQFLFDELNDAALHPNEQDTLEQEQQLLTHAETIKQGLSDVLSLCDNNDDKPSALNLILSAKSQLSKFTSFHPQVESFFQRIDSLGIELRDLCDEIEHLADNTTYDAQRQEQVDQRLDLIYHLQRKHNVDNIDQLLAIQDDLDNKLQQIANMEQEIQMAMEQVDRSFYLVQQTAQELTAHRVKAAQEVEQLLVPAFESVGMKDAQLKISITPSSDYRSTGHDDVEFLFNANKGGAYRELGKVASGGELSRLMLALKAIMAQQAKLPTIIFDEIDSGISGEVSAKVARIMQHMGDTMQVIAITHLPQMASAAEEHFKVFKQVEQERTFSCIRKLSYEERIHEIAVMLSSEPPTQSAITTAEELLAGKK